MLLALRSLFERAAVVVTPAGVPSLGRPLFREDGVAYLHGVEIRSDAGQILAKGTSSVFLVQANSKFISGIPRACGSGRIYLKGAEACASNEHAAKNASVILGRSGFNRNDDEDAALLLFLGDQ